MDTAPANGIPVIVVQHGAPETSPLMARGSEDWRLHPEIAARPRDLLLEKTMPGSFTGTELEAWLAMIKQGGVPLRETLLDSVAPGSK